MSNKEILDDYEKRKKKALQQGGPSRVKRQHDKGRLTARERIDKLLDPDSFMEFGLFCTSNWPGMADKTPADGLILGYGLIDGRRVGIIANDFTVLASTNAEINLKKMLQFKTQISKYKIPLIWLGEAGGGRVPDVQGSDGVFKFGGGGTDTLWPEYTHYREYPYVFAAMGDCHGVADFQACLADFVVQVKGSSIAVSGPRALTRAIGDSHAAEEMGGWELHSKVTGMNDQVVEDEDDCFRIIRKYLDYMPSDNEEFAAVRPVPEGSEERMAKILDKFPDNRRRAYDMHIIIKCIVDGGEIFELKPKFGAMLITCLARINGEVVGFIASNPIVGLGATDSDALEKSTTFMCLCDSFNIPIIFLSDTPGHLTGKEAERRRVGSRVVNNLQALFQVTVPKISIVIQKNYGQAMMNMSLLGSGYDFSVSWPTGILSFLDSDIAADVVNPKLPKEEREKTRKLMDLDTSPYPAARGYWLQDIIHPFDTRKYLINVLKIIRDSAGKGMSKHRLANWPKKL
ncbi:MAG: carboxyl transferase [Desulfobacterales bacterium]|nr:carboxyl transferase [Desulfobacterales bacterium]